MSRAPGFYDRPLVEYRGRMYRLTDLAEMLGSSLSTLMKRLERGMSIESAMNMTLRKPVEPAIGRRYGCLVVIRKGKRQLHYLCRCNCGSLLERHRYSIVKRIPIACQECSRIRVSRVYDYRGKKYTVPELAKLSGIKIRTIHKRIREGRWTVQEAVETPLYGAYHASQ